MNTIFWSAAAPPIAINAPWAGLVPLPGSTLNVPPGGNWMVTPGSIVSTATCPATCELMSMRPLSDPLPTWYGTPRLCIVWSSTTGPPEPAMAIASWPLPV